MTWCGSCGAQYEGSTHACGDARISKDRLRELLAIERAHNQRGVRPLKPQEDR